MKVVYHTRGAPSDWDPFGNNPDVGSGVDVTANLDGSGMLRIGTHAMVGALEGTEPGTWSRLAAFDPVDVQSRAAARGNRNAKDSAGRILDARADRETRRALLRERVAALRDESRGPPIKAASGSEFGALLVLVLELLDALDGAR